MFAFFSNKDVRVPPYSDDHGEWLSIYIPIQNSSKEVVAILEVDKKMNDLYAENRRAFLKNLFLFLLLVLGSLPIQIVIIKTIVKPLRKLTRAAENFGRGDYQATIESKSIDEVGKLAQVIEGARQEILSFITRILNTIPGLLITIDKDKKIQPQLSKVTTDLFGKEIINKSFTQTIFPKDTSVDTLTSLIFDKEKKLNFESLIELAPTDLEEKSKHEFRLSYHAIRKHDEITGILLFGQEVTEENKLKKHLEQEDQQNRMLITIHREHQIFDIFYEESLQGFKRAKDILSHPTTIKENINELLRISHSFKSSASGLELYPLINLAQSLELNLSKDRDTGVFGDKEKTLSDFKQLETELIRISDYVMNIFGKKNTEVKEIYPDEFDSLVTFLKEKNTDKAVSLLSTLKHPKLNEYIEPKLKNIFKQTKEKKGKEAILKMDITPLRVPLSVIKLLNGILPHLVRNALDHGIEDDKANRQKNGKSSEATVEVKLTSVNNLLSLVVSDDGKGIDGDGSSLLALEKGIITKKQQETFTDNEKIDLIFAPGFSTKDEPDEISGMGVGMDAVKRWVESANGKVNIQTEIGKGTKFVCEFPM